MKKICMKFSLMIEIEREKCFWRDDSFSWSLGELIIFVLSNFRKNNQDQKLENNRKT